MAIEWLKKILEGAKITDGALDVDALEAAVAKEMPKHTVPKDTYSAVKEKLDTANNQLSALSGTDVEQLKADLEAERLARAQERQEYQLRTAFDKAGATDPDYLIYKLGTEAKFGKDGKLEDVENFVKSAKEAHPSMFRQEAAYSPAGGAAAATVNPWKKDTFNMTKQGEILKADPAQAKELMAAAGITQE